MRYILQEDSHIPTLCNDVVVWAHWFENYDRHVKDEYHNGVRVSTIFLGIDTSLGHGPPMLFETMIFGGWYDLYQKRCSTWEQAETMHENAARKVKRLKRIPPEIQEIALNWLTNIVKFYRSIQIKVGAYDYLEEI